ncbi:SPX domain-containing protein [Radiomyces spectabilis]|uniref:SPX domain-containing protein n=1 Tax=Radiomyces spectabilis TaxID=64574 RepID=UPI00221ED696|nr:SPX domain-containing protein [Radiomyces spectabilis]KAI8377713.1 SPX domain-containing protein [Radiomyces spectabilis]
MKFAHSLILNAVPEWIDQYVDYDHLKKIVYRVEREIVQQPARRRTNVPIIMEEGEQKTEQQESLDEKRLLWTRDQQFTKALDEQLEKVVKFYAKKETEIMQDARALNDQFDSFGVSLPTLETIPHGNENDLKKLDTQTNRRVSTVSTQSSMDTVDDPTEQNLEGTELGNMQSFTTPSSLGRRATTSMIERPSESQPTTPERTTVRRRATTVEDGFRQRNEAAPNRIINPGLSFLRRYGSHPSLIGPAEGIENFNRLYNFRAHCAAIYISLSELRSYAIMNRTAFGKILKKWDKVTNSNLRENYFDKIVMNADPFKPEHLRRLSNAMQLIADMYAAIFTNGDVNSALAELKLHMRDHIQFERTTVWKDMIGQERRIRDAHVEVAETQIKIPFIHTTISKSVLTDFITFLFSLVVYIIFMSVDVIGDREANKCLALLLFSALLWAFESLPLYATAYLIPLMIVLMDIVKIDGQVVSAAVAAEAVFSSMFNGTVMVLLGGFAIAAALSKHGIAKAFAAVVMSRAGTKPRWVILVNMYLATFLSMWISNVATPVLCFSLAQPILRTLPPHSKVGPCLILGISLASCIGGLASPISSPQNIITINLMDPNPGWGLWFAAALPIAIITVATTWVLLLLYFRPEHGTPNINKVKSQVEGKPSFRQVWVCFICILTIALWCAESALANFWGDNGVIAVIPFVLLFGTRMLTKTDLNNFLWSVVVLAQGGMALGFAVKSSGLLDIIGHRIATGVEDLQVLAIIFIFGILVLVFSTFVSHTVAALIILPIVKHVGEQLTPPRPNLLVMVTGLVCSVAMGLPVSGFPNMNAIMQEDAAGKAYLKIKDFILCGIPASIVAGIIAILLGYAIVSGVGY